MRVLRSQDAEDEVKSECRIRNKDICCEFQCTRCGEGVAIDFEAKLCWERREECEFWTGIFLLCRPEKGKGGEIEIEVECHVAAALSRVWILVAPPA